ncbi:restriction endonuclease [Rhodanobacter sp. Root627]|uniref:HNH endonuclease n=1 Tax=Rhodanobacter sp. Root627 TaxID=1736572 RepID=UPI0006F88919|nr:HNH endonuclease [Rhodanobacter sp. Root627]KRA33536.1 restriction endonuclease [Rhodanobacter sp. Root627]
MNPLQRALIEKAGHDHGFEYVLPSDDGTVRLASALHRAQAVVTPRDHGFELVFSSAGPHLLQAELVRTFPASLLPDGSFVATEHADLAQILRRAAALARALPNQAAMDFEAQVAGELAQLSSDQTRDTEVERMVRQRVGQQTLRQAMLNYWGNACAVTGVSHTAVLRASHAKPWAECKSDAERLDVFNGFLLNANLDALFDRFLISFSSSGKLLVSPAVCASDRMRLGLDQTLHLRWLADEHAKYLEFHRARFEAIG